MTPNEDSILVVGGYGTIGRTVCLELARSTTGDVVAAGRTARKAREFATDVDGVQSGVVDITNPDSYDDALKGVGTVVMCLDQDDPTFARTCLERGIDYVDVTPTDRLIRAIESFDETAREHGATGVLSVGLSPGMTNLFAADAIDALDTVEQADITLLLGLGEDFGPDTIKWTIEDAFDDFSMRDGGSEILVDAFGDSKVVDIPGYGPRRAYRANLADQHVLARTTDVPSVATWLCYDSATFTHAVATLVRHGLFRPLASRIGAVRLAWLLNRVPLGASESVVHVAVSGVNGGAPTRITRWVLGSDQARATALVAVATYHQLQRNDVDSGVHHLHLLFSSSPFVAALRDGGYTVEGAQTPIDTVSNEDDR